MFIFCNKCGSEISQGANFCDKCGQAVYMNNMNIKNNHNMIICKSCGANVAKTAKCCPKCGAKTPGQLLGESVIGVGCGLLAVPVILFLIAFYVLMFIGIK